MKRKEFIRNLALTVGGTTLLSCEADLLSDLLPTNELQNIEIDEAKEWFNNIYLKKFTSLKVGNKKQLNRKVKWDKAMKNIDDIKGDFVMVPIEYDENTIPGLLTYDNNTKYRQELRDGFIFPIIEYLIVLKKNNKNETFLAQLAYDPYERPKTSDKFIDINKFTG